MSRERACPDCGSPARGNPCWYGLKYPGSGGDPPCYDWFDGEDGRRRRKANARWFRIIVGTLAAFTALLFAGNLLGWWL